MPRITGSSIACPDGGDGLPDETATELDCGRYHAQGQHELRQGVTPGLTEPLNTSDPAPTVRGAFWHALPQT
jgi:hypothetical protein